MASVISSSERRLASAFFFKANRAECRMRRNASSIIVEANSLEYLYNYSSLKIFELLRKSLRFLLRFFPVIETDHAFFGRSSKMTGGKLKSRLRLLEYIARKAAASRLEGRC